MIVGLLNDNVAVQLDRLDALGGNKISRIDAFGFIDGVVAAPAKFHLTNVQGQFMTLDQADGTVAFASAKRRAAAQWLFWDDLHPTTRGHELFATSALKTLRAAFPAVHETHGGCR